eukprot:gene21465-biopygen1146
MDNSENNESNEFCQEPSDIDENDNWTEEESKPTGVSDTLLQESDVTETVDSIINVAPGEGRERAIIQAIDLVIGDLAEDVKENTSWQVQVAFLIHQPKDTSINALTSNAIDITLSQLPKLKANQKVNVTVTCSFGEEPPKNVLIQDLTV